jgi:hypothetical protein
MRRVWWLGDDRNVFLGEELQLAMCGLCIIVMQKPLFQPLVLPLPLNCIAQALQNLHVEMTSNTLSRRYELMVHQTINVKEFQELFDCSL